VADGNASGPPLSSSVIHLREMLKPENIIKTYDRDLVELSSMVVRKVRGKTEDGTFVDDSELQFQVKNISNVPLAGLEVEVNFHTDDGKFVGTDSDSRLEVLNPQEIDTFAMFLVPLEEVASAELTVKTHRYSYADKINKIATHPIGLIVLFLMFIYLIYLEFKS